LCQNESNCKSSGDSRIENKAAPKRNNPLGQVHCCCRFRRRHLKRCRPKSASGNCEDSRHYFGPKNGLGSAKNLLGSNHRRAQAAKRGEQHSHHDAATAAPKHWMTKLMKTAFVSQFSVISFRNSHSHTSSLTHARIFQIRARSKRVAPPLF